MNLEYLINPIVILFIYLNFLMAPSVIQIMWCATEL